MLQNSDKLTISLAQISPVLLNKTATIDKVCQSIGEAAKHDSGLIVFGEALLPGYPFWVDLTGGAAFNSAAQKAYFAGYVRNAVDIDAGDIAPVCELDKKHSIAVYLGTIERPQDRTGMSLYCSMV